MKGRKNKLRFQPLHEISIRKYIEILYIRSRGYADKLSINNSLLDLPPLVREKILYKRNL